MKNSGNNKSVTIHRRVKSVATTDRKQAKRPAAKETVTSDNSALDAAIASEKKSQGSMIKVKRSGMISHFGNTTPTKTSIGIRVVDSSSSSKSSAKSSTGRTTSASKSSSSETVVMHPMLRVARARMQEHHAQGYYTQESRVKTRMESSNRMQSRRMASTSTKSSTQSESAIMTAQQAKDMAIQKALASTNRATAKEEVKTHKLHFSFGRILVAMGCAAAAIFAIIYFINLNMSDFSLYAAAKQAGIESANREPRVPQEYSISNISSENGKIEISYKNSENNNTMTITEEKSSWDSNALLNNYVRVTYGVGFATIREQGLTIYISESNACWVNGGIVYKITAPAGSLDKKQIRQIATSM